MDWVAQHPQEIQVANLSLGGFLEDPTPVREAVDGMIAAGITVVVAAGNDGADARSRYPGGLESVITVSALADSNGLAGAAAGIFRVDRYRSEQDESFADFSNFGPRIDLIAPGVRILSTWKKRKYARVSGTSQAAPHVAGAAALYKVANPGAAPTEVEAALKARGALFEPPDDPDGIHEPALDVSGL
jgi:subtilisin family serine protease